MNGRSMLLVLVSGLVLTTSAQAEVKLPSIFSDNAVIQSETKVPIWGWADKEKEVTIEYEGKFPNEKAGFGVKPFTVKVKNGKWKAHLDSIPPGSVVTIRVKGQNQITIQNVLAGEVWLCSGQSNMAMTVNRCDNLEREQKQANYPQIRMFKVANNPQTKPQDDVPGQWIICSPETVAGFSGTAYFFGRKIHKELNVPVGLINSSVGGTAVEAWTSIDVQKGNKTLEPIFDVWHKKAKGFDLKKALVAYEKALAKWKTAAAKARKAKKKIPRRPRMPVEPLKDRNYPSNLFNGMIHPLIPYAIRGAIWYQGENNANRIAELYGVQLPLLVKDWRARWGQGDFPFLWVQLPNFRKRVDEPVQQNSGWALVREGMLKSLRVPNTGMAVTIDVGDPNDIHPTNKQDFGGRLANVALASVYKKKNVAETGPLYRKHKITDGKVLIEFDHTHGGLANKGKELKGFAISSKNGEWLPAEAKIEGDQVVVLHPQVKTPVAVRYGWADNPEVTLYNGAGLPASPFRTDGK